MSSQECWLGSGVPFRCLVLPWRQDRQWPEFQPRTVGSLTTVLTQRPQDSRALSPDSCPRWLCTKGDPPCQRCGLMLVCNPGQ